MLIELRAAGIGVIESAVVEFEPGLNVLTGETGAGKSMIVGALALLCGGRADADVLRVGHDEGEVEARFVSTNVTIDMLCEAGIPIDEELVLARRIRKGSSRAYVNGRMVTVTQLGAIGRQLFEIIGQHSARSLLQPAAQRRMLDRFCGAEADKPIRAVEQAWDYLRSLEAELTDIGADPVARARDSEALRFALDEIDAVGAILGEDEQLSAELRRLANAQSLRDDAGGARAAVDRARDDIAIASTGLERIDDPECEEIATSLNTALVHAEVVSEALRDFLDACADDPYRLEAVQERLAAIRELTRKYGPTLEAVLDFRDQARGRLGVFTGASERAAELDMAIVEARRELEAAARHLSEVRRKAAPELAERTTNRLVDLALPAARLCVDVSASMAIERHGGDDIELRFSAARTVDPRPLGKVASGGEVSRVLLALAGEIATLEAPTTMVFDEVDAGTGGRSAIAVGHALAEQAHLRQLICVTHLAQVAAFADCHIVLDKDETGNATATPVRGEARIVELSRMLSGSPDSKRAHEHARELIEVVKQSGKQSWKREKP